MKIILRGLAFILIILIIPACATIFPKKSEPQIQQLLVDEARIVVDAFGIDPEMKWGREYFKGAEGVLIIPDLYKGAWFFGASGGKGILLVRDQEKDGWFGPAFYTIGSVSFGVQFGGQKSEAIILVMTKEGVELLQKTSVKLGGDGSVAIGPVGVGGQGAIAPTSLNADYITIARSRGAFIGVSFDGAIIHENYDWNKAYYGKPVRPIDIITTHSAINPNADELRSAVAKLMKTEQ